MKRIYTYLILMCFTFISCSSEDESISIPENPTNKETINSKPTKPTLIYPSKDLICTYINLDFEWNSSNDIDDDLIKYEISIAQDEYFNDLSYNTILSGTSSSFTLEKGKTYYWKVQAIDSENNKSDSSDIWKFYTEGEATTNSLPYLPVVNYPFNGSEVESTLIRLVWKAVDQDGDYLSYDIYLGTDLSSVNLVHENWGFNWYETQLNPETEYFWKINVKDDKGGITYGPVWNFKTK